MNIFSLDSEGLMALADKISDLHEACFHHPLTPGYLRWRYLDNPSPDGGPFANVAMEGDRLAAFYAVSPLSIRFRDGVQKSALSLNTMTHPDFAGRGLFVTLAKATYGQLAAAGVHSVIGFSNAHSNRTFGRALGFRTVHEIPMLEMPLEGRAGDPDGLELEFDDAFRLTYPPEVLAWDRNVQVAKDVAYLAWRYGRCVTERYRNVVVAGGGAAKAFAVCKVWRDRLNLVELHLSSMDFAPELLKRCVALARSLSCGFVTTWAPVDTELHWFLEKSGFINRYPVHYFIARQLTPAQDAIHDMTDVRNWHVQLGDNNTY